MSFTKVFYGVEEPSQTRKIVINAIFLTMALAFYGGWMDFLPSHDWSRAGMGITGLLSLIATILFVFSYSTGQAQFIPGISRFKKVLSYLILPIILFGFIWFAIVRGAASGVTLAFGAPSAIDVVAWKEVSHSRRLCNYRLRAKELEPGLQSYICLSEQEYSALPDRSMVTLIGLKSPLGFTITSWKMKSANTALQPTSGRAAAFRG